MDPAEASDLVAAFVETDGTEVIFSRITDATTSPPIRIYATCFAAVHNYTARELGNGIEQGDTQLIIEGDALPALAQRLGTPPRRDDKVSYAGFERNVQSVAPLIIAGQVVRIDVVTRG
jgi:hypothetical protein